MRWPLASIDRGDMRRRECQCAGQPDRRGCRGWPAGARGLHLHDLLASVPVNLFQDAELNPATQQYELVLNNDDLQQELTQSGIVGHFLVLTEQDLQQLLGDVPL